MEKDTGTPRNKKTWESQMVDKFNLKSPILIILYLK
jgi:hypothetical protein